MERIRGERAVPTRMHPSRDYSHDLVTTPRGPSLTGIPGEILDITAGYHAGTSFLVKWFALLCRMLYYRRKAVIKDKILFLREIERREVFLNTR